MNGEEAQRAFTADYESTHEPVVMARVVLEGETSVTHEEVMRFLKSEPTIRLPRGTVQLCKLSPSIDGALMCWARGEGVREFARASERVTITIDLSKLVEVVADKPAAARWKPRWSDLFFFGVLVPAALVAILARCCS